MWTLAVAAAVDMIRCVSIFLHEMLNLFLTSWHVMRPTAAEVLQTRKEDPFVGGAGAAVDSAATPVYSRCLSRLIFQDT